MAAVVSMLRGVNLGTRRMKMEQLRALYETLGLRGAQTYVQSGNVVFRSANRGLENLAKRIEDAIEQEFGFSSDVILRTAADMRDVVSRNPFEGREGIEPGKLLVWFLASDPGEEARVKVRAVPADPEEVRIDGRELYIYFPNGMARPKLSMAACQRALKIPGTGRNWNTVVKLLEMAEALEA
jgi:uncharacterized protein (DUF1697 family)